MVWRFVDPGSFRDPWRELRQLRRDMEHLFGQYAPERQSATFPAVNLWGNQDVLHMTAELAGIDPEGLEITVKDDQLTVRGSRNAPELAEGDVFHRQERGAGEFVKAVGLPYTVDPDKVDASYRLGVLMVTLHRAEADKPRKVQVKTG